MAGYVARKIEEKEISNVGAVGNANSNRILIKKLRKATKKISTLKTVIKIGSSITHRAELVVGKTVDNLIAEELEKTKLNHEVLADAFSVGDLEKIVLLKKIKTEIGSQNDKEKTNSAAV